MTDRWEVRPCKDRLGHVTSWDVCLPTEPDATGVAVVAAVYSGEAVANEIADAHNTTLQGSAALPSEPHAITCPTRYRRNDDCLCGYTAMRATTPTAPDQDTGASVPDQALAVPVEPVSRLDPSGFDPSRGSFVEQVARAMFDCYSGYNAETQEMLWQSARYGLIRQAYRALGAMREPTEAMLAATEREWDGRMSFRSTGAWQAMIDAAIQDGAEQAHHPRDRTTSAGRPEPDTSATASAIEARSAETGNTDSARQGERAAPKEDAHD